ncbi:c-type cytochrome [Schauerella aestuarii]|uniref:c-type cytochrome n=1 Tax=Schauerella aestuarii TaxID=2511204 RepID=UPI001F454320|nr:c-type cytochrome [Achromobacter aestuarii]
MMQTNRMGMMVTVGLMIGLPVITLVATGYQMVGLGGEGLIRPTAVTPRAAPIAAPAAATGAAPATGTAPASPAQGTAPATSPNTSPTTTSGAPAAGSAAPAAAAGGMATTAAPAAPAAASQGTAPTALPAPTPVPGRSALDFSPSRPSWEAPLQKADAKMGQQLASAGRPAGGVQACVACHGAQGVAAPGGIFPNLAGLSGEYMAKQLTDYRSGARNHPLMTAIAKGMTDDEIGQVSKYYASLPAQAVAPKLSGPESARKLDVLGENGRALPACANCHGVQGQGEGPLLPRLAGQPKGYFIDQMNAFRNGQRQNDDVGVMRAFAQRLTPEEIDALGTYYEGMTAAAK